MRIPGGNGKNIGSGVGRNVGLTGVIAAPGDERAIRHDGKVVGDPGGDGHVRQGAGRNVCLAIAVVAPAKNGAVVPEGDGVIVAAGDANRIN